MPALEHAPLSFSASERWINCPASYREAESLPPFKGNAYTEAGTAAHELAEKTIRKLLAREGYLSGSAEVLAYLDATMDVPTQLQGPEAGEHLRAVAAYVAYVIALAHDGFNIELEQRVQVGEDALQLFGTCDCIAVNRQTGVLKVIDYKHGRGYRVPVTNNYQLLSYLAGVLDRGPERLKGVSDYRLVIVQPRARDGHAISECQVSFDDAWDHMLAMLEARKQALGPEPPYGMGDWCRWCPALAICPEIAKRIAGGVALGAGTTAKLTKALDLVETIEQWAAAVRQLAHDLLDKGGKIEGWALYPKRATRKWIDMQDAFNLLTDLGVLPEKILEERLRTPAQVEKLLPPATWQKVEDAVVVAQSSGTTLARFDPERENKAGSVSAEEARAWLGKLSPRASLEQNAKDTADALGGLL